MSKKLYPYCLVLVGSRNGFERVWKIDLNVVKTKPNIKLWSLCPVLFSHKTYIFILYCPTHAW